MCFCETNPPFFDGIFNGSSYEYIGYDGKFREKSVGSFWKTNPPERGFEGVSTCFDPHLRHEERADADAMGCGRKVFWRCWLLEKLLVSRETPRQARGDRLEEAYATYNDTETTASGALAPQFRWLAATADVG